MYNVLHSMLHTCCLEHKVCMCVTGPSRRFKRICELLQSLLLSSNRGQTTTGRRISAEMTSDSSSSSYSSMDRVSPTPPDDVSA